MVNKNEEYIMENIAFKDHVPSLHNPDQASCPHTIYEENRFTKQFTLFFWTKETSYKVEWASNVAFVSFLLAGIYSDKYGGHRAVLFGLLISTVVTSLSYLTFFMDANVYLLMLALRRSAYSVVFSASISLAGKLSKPYRRTMFISIVLAGARLGAYLGYVVTSVVDDWRVVSYISGGICFTTFLWWWVLYKFHHFPRVPTYKKIPWRKLLVSVTFVNLWFLVFSFYLFFKTSIGRPPLFELYIKNVLFFRPDNEWFAMLLLCITKIFAHLYCGASCDYLVSTGLLSTFCVRRIFYTAALVVFLFSVVVTKIAECNITFAVACWILLWFVSPIANSIAFSEVLDVAPKFSGTLLGAIYAPLYLVYYAIAMFLQPTFISDDTLGDPRYWSYLFFTLTVAIIGSALPYLLFGVKTISSRNEVSIQTGSRILSKKSSPYHVRDKAFAGPSDHLNKL